jgi:Family of unknown function (DUF6252)
MKKNINIIGLVLLLAVTLSASKCKKTSPTQLEQLPPATQTGANTFGCLLNGVAFTPGGGGLLDQILIVQFDPTFQGGRLSIKAKRIFNSTEYITMSIGGDSILLSGTFNLGYKTKYKVYYFDSRKLCDVLTYSTPAPSIVTGKLEIIKFDYNSRIISGIFDFNISMPNCDSIKATDGRFDVKF